MHVTRGQVIRCMKSEVRCKMEQRSHEIRTEQKRYNDMANEI